MEQDEMIKQEWNLYWEVFFESLDQSQCEWSWESDNEMFNPKKQKGDNDEEGI